MKTTTPRKTRPASLSTRGLGNLPLSYLVVIAICGCVIAAGFLLAARQHFMSMDLGMKNSKLRQQLEDLETEQRRLVLVREVALSPREITRTARNLGFADTLEATLAMPVPAAQKPANSNVTNASVIKINANGTKSSGVAKIAYQRAVQPVAAKTTAKPSKNG